MEFLDMLVRALDGCTGLLEVLTVVLDAAAVYLGTTTYQKHKQFMEKVAHAHGKAALKKPTWWPVVILAVLGVALTALTIWKWSRLAR